MREIPVNIKRMAAFAGIIILMAMVMDFNTRLETLHLLNKELDESRARATQAIQTENALRTAVAYANSGQAVEEWARSEGHYVQEGDRPVVPVGQSGSDPVIETIPAPAPTPMQNWEVWWKLFFDE